MCTWMRESVKRYLANGRYLAVAFVLSLSVLCAVGHVHADEIRVVDARGLVRAVKVTKGALRMVVILEPANSAVVKGECVATNVDGLAAEKRVPVSPQSECTFTEVSGGSWQVSVPQGATWRVQLYE
jgi:hypothetical protein